VLRVVEGEPGVDAADAVDEGDAIDPVVAALDRRPVVGLDAGLEGFTPVPDGIIRVKGIKGS